MIFLLLFYLLSHLCGFVEFIFSKLLFYMIRQSNCFDSFNLCCGCTNYFNHCRNIVCFPFIQDGNNPYSHIISIISLEDS